MELRPGYKRTELGVIPDDWETRQLSDHFRIYAGGDVPKHALSETRSESHPYPIFANALQRKGLYGFTSERRATRDSLTITARGFLGHAEYRDEEFFPIVRLLVLEPTGFLDPRFTALAVNERVTFAFESTGVPQLTAPQVGKYSVAAPGIEEQTAIATALGDVDALLAAQDALIDKKRAIKQGAMQELLTGKRRLPGFSGEWEVKRLGDIAHIKTGSRNNEHKVEGGDYPFFVRSEFVERIDGYAYDCEAILVPGEGKIGEIFHYITGRFDVHQRVYAITQFAADVSGQFVHLFMKAHFGQWAMQNTVKATVDSLRLPTFQNFQMRLPPTKDEQAEIVKVLCDMDAELTSLEAQRAKTVQLKQGMMQELLTGRIRLV